MLNMLPKRSIVITTVVGLCVLISFGIGSALDAPHAGLGYENVQCSNCHILHGALGDVLTAAATNANLCMSCHVTGGSAGNWPFSSSDQADLVAKTGTSHRWDADMGTMGLLPSSDPSAPNNKYGLRPVAEIANSEVKRKAVAFNNQVVCSVCHLPHNYSAGAPFDPYAAGGRSQYAGTATGGSSTTVAVSGAGWGTNAWSGYYVKMTSGANSGKRRRITANDGTTLTTDAFPFANTTGNTFYISGIRHYMRMATSSDEMCKDCHYYRTPASAPGGVPQTNVRTWDGNRKSHPIGKNLSAPDVSDATQFNATPLEPSTAVWAQQSGTRYEINGGTDANLSNNITFGADGKVSCLSCHSIHYTDTDTLTVDTPSGYAP